MAARNAEQAFNRSSRRYDCGMNYDLLLEIGTILSVVALIIPFLAACGVFKSRRQREVEASFKQKLRQGSRQPVIAGGPSAAQFVAPPMPAPTLASVPSGSGGGYDPRLRSRSKSFDATSTQATIHDHHAAEHTQRRFRRTRCIVRNHAKSSCPHCGYLL